ncbi:unnamed protein product [Diatraea saccharalis]|uniref:Uncharacterized protein n=1 Tax=Diatraea saccharalis TaxID=40085 RepID=A0A9N9QUR8_9NEOP|nr:unnamed protein product [Diatraea saccharalis]
MYASVKRFLKWGASRKLDIQKSQQTQSYHIISILKGVLEDILFWKRVWLSLTFIFVLNVTFFIFINKQINILEVVLYFCVSFISIDAFETWLKHKHRTTCLKRLSDHSGDELSKVTLQVRCWLHKKWIEYMYLRETNHTKAFILVNLVLGGILILGKCMGGYLLFYVLCMAVCFINKLAPPAIKIVKKLQQNADSDMEFEGLIPEVTDNDIKLLSIEPEQNQLFDERQSLDYWKPDDLPIEEVSDSSENSSSLVTNLSMEKMRTFDKDVDTTDSSDDEYIPIERHKEHLQSTVEVAEQATTWSSSAYNVLWNLTGAVSNMMYTKTDDNKRKRVASADSSDGFEIVDKHDLM